jgi:hypothetical protein
VACVTGPSKLSSVPLAVPPLSPAYKTALPILDGRETTPAGGDPAGANAFLL